MKRSRDGLYRRGGVFAFRYQDKDGVWREKYTGKAYRTEAKAFKVDFEENLRRGVPILPSTFRALLKYREEAGLDTQLTVAG